MHEGHRQRMYEKLNNGDELHDHEVLEMLLYAAYPRVNTNPISHALLDRFASLSEMFNASVDELKGVSGVGDNAAYFIKCVGLCAERAGRVGNTPTLKTYGDCKSFIDLRLRGKGEEFIELYFVSKAYRVQRIFTYTSGEKSRAATDIEDVARDIALNRPYGIIIAHNHVDGTIAPSDYDDNFTRIVQFICNMNKVKLLEHMIYLSRDEVFSYREDGRLDKVKNFCSWDKFDKWIKTLN